MKAKRRHELKENVLAHELQQFKSFLSRYGGWLAGAIVVIAIGWMLYGQYRGKAQQALDVEKDRFNALSQNPRMEKEGRLKGFIELAGSAQDPILAAASAVRAANLYSQDFLTYLQEANTAKAEEARESAEKYYRMAVAGVGARAFDGAFGRAIKSAFF